MLQIVFICWGVVPQHPPAKFINPVTANSSINSDISCGVSSYSPNSFGNPALGYTKTNVSAIFDKSFNHGLISLAPRAQLSPTAVISACLIEFQNASTVCPERVLPLASVIVPDTNKGKSLFFSSNNSLTANIAALQLRVSKTVSIKKRSTPPSNNPFACS